MASAPTIILETNDFRNWTKGHLAASFAKEGLTQFIANEINSFHEDLITNSLFHVTTCRCCTTANLLVCPTKGFCRRKEKYCIKHYNDRRKEKYCIKHYNESYRRCPNGYCDKLKKAIHRQHVYGNPSWSNSDATQWCTNPFEICKCFLPPGFYSKKRSLYEVDFSGLLAIIINMKLFKPKLSVDLNLRDNVLEARDAWRGICHSPDLLLSDEQLEEFIDILLDILKKPILAHDLKAREAVEKLNKLKSNSLIIKTDEINEVLRANVNSMCMDKTEEILRDITDRDLQSSAIEKIQNEQEKLMQQLDNATQEIEIQRKSIQKREGQTDEEDSLPEPSYWNYYLRITEGDAELEPAKRLKQAEMLPNQDQLNQLQNKLLKTKSKTTSDLLNYIENLTKKSVLKINKNVINPWLAYTKENSGDIYVTLILEMENPSDESTLVDIPYDYKVFKVNSFSDEAKLVIDKSIGHEELSICDSIEMKMCIKNNASRLMKDHKHLAIINASSVRSKGFSLESDRHTLIKENCLVLYVRKKGFIPIGELPFEDNYDGIPTDVREGMFFTHMQASNETEGTLKMGSRIFKRLSPLDGGGYICGTLGGFIDHPQYGLCGLTCAHVLLDDIEMTKLQDNGELSWLDFAPDSASVYQLEENEAENYIKIGRVVKASLTNGDNGSNGLETAIFQIERFFPSRGLFVNVRTQDDDPLHFDSGKACGPSRFSTALNVFKYGSTTGKTRGTFQNHLPVITVRLQSDTFPKPAVLHNQIEIKGIDGTVFSDKGDSGAMVMIDGHNGERFCIGIVEGGTSYGTTVVTPIIKILDKMDVSSLKCFEADHLRDSVRTLEETTRSLVETTRRLEEKSDEILSAIRQINVRP